MLEALMLIKKAAAPPSDEGLIAVVPVEEFIDGATLAANLSFTNGAVITAYNTEPWLQIKYQGKTLYIPKKPLRNSVHWNHLNTANLITGARTIDIGGNTYKVRLFTGSTADPFDGSTTGGEWNDIIYKLWSGNPNGVASNWAQYTTAELGQDGAGRYTWCKETAASNASYCCTRGNPNPTGIGVTQKGSTSTNYGWRPILELVE